MEGWGFELTSTFKLKLDMFNWKLFLKNEDKSVLIKYLLPAYFYIQVLFSFLLDEEKCHSWYKDIFVSSIPNFIYKL